MRMRRTLRIGFVAVACLSLLANAAVIGVTLRAYQAGIFPLSGAADLFVELSTEDRHAFVANLKREEATITALRDTLQLRRREMLRMATAENPDPAAVRAAMARVDTAAQDLRSALQGLLLETFVEEAPPE